MAESGGSTTATASARALTGLLGVYQDLQPRLAQQPGLLAIAAEPCSGTSALLAVTLEEIDYAAFCADARACGSAGDLAAAIAEAAVASLAPEALAWWAHRAPATDTEGLRLGHALHERGLEVNRLRDGEGSGLQLLDDALAIACALGVGPTLVAIDHLDRLLDDIGERSARELLGTLRAARQATPDLQLLLVGRSGGPVELALRDAAHPLYRAGQQIDVRRPKPRQYVDDLVVTRPWSTVAVDVLGAAAELANGVPFITWQIVDLTPAAGGVGRERALAGWQHLRALSDAQCGLTFDLLRGVHPIAQAVVAAISRDGQPYRVGANNKSISDALARLRQLGVVFQPKPRTWAVANPLLLAWIREKTRGPRQAGDVHTIKVDDGWVNIYEGESTIIDRAATKADAVAAGRERARRHGVGHVIHATDGRMAKRNTYRTDPAWARIARSQQ